MVKKLSQFNNFEKNVSDTDVSILLTNRNGAYALFSGKTLSRYEGVFFKNNDRMMKIIESIHFASPVTAITNHLWGVTVKRGELSETMFMPLNKDALIVNLSSISEFELVLDAKISEDNRVWGRNYEVNHEDHTIIIKFSKKNDGRDDNSVFNNEFEFYLALYSPELEYQHLQTWEEHFYPYDEERHSPPFNRWVFKACRIRTKDFVCAWSSKKSDAISSAKDIFESRDRLKRERENHVNSLISKIPSINNGEVLLAYQCSINALDSLMIDETQIIAGLPWFYQRWSRDEIICTKSIMIQKNYGLARKLLFDYFPKINKNGLLSNMCDKETSLLAVDAVGWLFFRCHELMLLTSRKKSEMFSKKEKSIIVDKLESSLSAIFKNRFIEGLIRVDPMETWMDTEFGDDRRFGAVIEIQALMLFMCKMLRKLSGKKDQLEVVLASNVRKFFFKNKTLLDVAGQNIVRPNIFIAAYVYPELLSNIEWENCFDEVLPKLWLDWGGLSSIDKRNKFFIDVYTGEDNKSYHRGDSWFWLNNLAAIVLNRINSKKFSYYVNRILQASTSEILYKGATGFAAEISSAKELSSKGCVAQAWSSALYVELIDELFKNQSP